MDRALDILDRGLRGDPSALSFLERTASIYLLDATKPGSPTTYGCWNFINEALNGVERYEAHQAAHHGAAVNLEGHVQLLATMARRAAKRSPASDRNQIGTCLANASQYHASAAEAQALIDLNSELRERVMGRIAAMAFDFSFHNGRGPKHSAFSNPVAMENLCAVVAANSVSSGPDAISHLVVDLIVPSVENLPPFAVAAVLLHVAGEATGNAAPAGTKETLRKLSRPVVAGVLAPLLAEAIRESDTSEASGEGGQQPMNVSSNKNRRLAALALKALERWCSATELSAAQLKHLCNGSKVDIVEVLSDSLYSDADIVIDALAELLETLLQRNAQNALSLEGVVLARLTMGGTSTTSSPLVSTEAMLREEERARDSFLEELISAVALQRFRFTGRQSYGDVAACRCLARIAASVAIASQAMLRSGQSQGPATGMIDLLLKAAAHPSVHVCGIALEALPKLVSPQSDLSIRLLTVLQRRAIVPQSLVGVSTSSNADGLVDCGVDFHEFENFREHLLCDGLVACYMNSRGFYMDSCTSAVEEFCAAGPTVEVSFQLEAALFCLNAVAMDSSKRALLLNASPAAQAAARKASSLTKGHAERGNIADDARLHDEQLRRCTAALAKKPVCATSNPLTLAQMCRFLGKHASWFSKSEAPGVLDSAADLALSSFNFASAAFRDDASARRIVEEMSMSPLAEAASALRNILSRSPAHFTTPPALAALGGGWEASYATSSERISIEDREALCSGICRVLASLPSEQWVSSLSALARPTIECLEAVSKQADGVLAANSAASNQDLLSTVLVRVVDEIRLLSTMTKTFNNAVTKSSKKMSSGCTTSAEDTAYADHPSVVVIRRVWPCLCHVAQRFVFDDAICNVLGDFLTGAVSVQEQGRRVLSLLKDMCELAVNVVRTAKSSLSPMLQFVREVVDVYGHMAEMGVLRSTSSSSRKEETQVLIESILLVSFEGVQSAVGELYTHGKEQGRGQKPFESRAPTPQPEQKEPKKSPDAIAGLFSILTCCMQRCPLLIIKLSAGSVTDQDEDGMFVRAIEAAAATLGDKEVDASRSAMIFLKAAIELSESTKVHGKESIAEDSVEIRSRVVCPAVDGGVARVRGVVVMTLIGGACGTCPREVLDPAAALLHCVLRTSPPEEAEASVIAALKQEKFLLGDDARNVSLTVMGKCATGASPPSVLMDFFSDLWQMHQTDDAGAVAGGESVVQFAQKYSS